MVPLLLTTLACNAVTQWISPHSPTTTDPIAQSPSPLSAESYAACLARFPDILAAGASGGTAGASSLFPGSHQVRYLVVYDLDGNDLGKRDDLLIPDQLDNNIDSRAAHQQIWNYFTALIPPGYRNFVTEFSILSDGPNNILAGVSPTYDDPSQWTLKVDVVDASDPNSLTYSLLHEFGHLLTLNSLQVPPNDEVFFHPDDRALYDQAVASCPRYFTGEGCSNSGSYINEFYNRFWSSSYAEWQASQAENFFHQHPDQFLTYYAATSPQEDIAESWAYFILSPMPQPTSIASEKILFFYQYPELVTLRQEILTRLCTSFPTK